MPEGKGGMGRASGVLGLRVKGGPREDNPQGRVLRNLHWERIPETFRRSFAAERLAAHAGEKTN